MLNVEPKSQRVAKNLRLLPEAVELIKKLAVAYGTSEGKIIEALVMEYGPEALKEKRN
jgi:hypothetical protein